MNIALLILLIGQWLMALVSMGAREVKGAFATRMWIAAVIVTLIVAVGGWL